MDWVRKNIYNRVKRGFDVFLSQSGPSEKSESIGNIQFLTNNSEFFDSILFCNTNINYSFDKLRIQSKFSYTISLKVQTWLHWHCVTTPYYLMGHTHSGLAFSQTD